MRSRLVSKRVSASLLARCAVPVVVAPKTSNSLVRAACGPLRTTVVKQFGPSSSVISSHLRNYATVIPDSTQLFPLLLSSLSLFTILISSQPPPPNLMSQSPPHFVVANSVQLGLGPDQIEMQNVAKEFAQKEMLPYAEQWDEKEIFPVDTLRKLAELGFAGEYTPFWCHNVLFFCPFHPPSVNTCASCLANVLSLSLSLYGVLCDGL